MSRVDENYVDWTDEGKASPAGEWKRINAKTGRRNNQAKADWRRKRERYAASETGGYETFERMFVNPNGRSEVSALLA